MKSNNSHKVKKSPKFYVGLNYIAMAEAPWPTSSSVVEKIKAEEATLSLSDCPYPRSTPIDIPASNRSGYVGFFQHHIDSGTDPDTIDVEEVVKHYNK